MSTVIDILCLTDHPTIPEKVFSNTSMCVVRFGTASQVQLTSERDVYRAEATLTACSMLEELCTRAVLRHCTASESKLIYKGAVGQTSATRVD